MNIRTLMADVRGVLVTREIKRLMPVSYKAEPFVGPMPAPVLTDLQKEIAAWNAAVEAKKSAKR